MSDGENQEDRKVIIPKTLEGNPSPRPEERVAAIRDLIKANPDTILKIEDFSKAADVAGAYPYIERLKKEGKIVRKQVVNGFKGHQYTYAWVDNPKPKPNQDNEESTFSIEELEDLSNEWVGTVATADTENALAIKSLTMVQFIQWLKTQTGEQK